MINRAKCVQCAMANLALATERQVFKSLMMLGKDLKTKAVSITTKRSFPSSLLHIRFPYTYTRYGFSLLRPLLFHLSHNGIGLHKCIQHTE